MRQLTDGERRENLVGDLRSSISSTGWLLTQAADEIERLVDERDDLIEQLAIRSESGMAKDMQKIMAINNELLEENRELKSREGA